MVEQNIDHIIQNLILDFNKKEYQKVINSSLKLVDQKYNIPVLFNLLGASLSYLKDYHQALFYYFKAIKIDEGNEEILRNIGKCYLSLNKYSDAEIYFKNALNIKKNNPDALFNIGLVRALSNDSKGSIHFLNKALEIKPSFVECIYNLGLCYKNLGEYKKATEYYLKAININPKHFKSYNNLGVCYLLLNDHNKALIILNKCLKQNPNYSYALNNLGSVYLALKKYYEAENYFTKAYDLNKKLMNAGIQKIFLKRKKCDWSSEHEIANLMKDTVSIDAEVIPWQCLGMEDEPKYHLIRAKKYSKQFQLKSENNTIYNNAKIRIGYFASDFYQHPGMINMLGIFKSHNKNKFEIIGFYYGEIKKDKMHNKIKSYFDEFYYVENLTDEGIANLSKKIKIDIAINRSGHTDKARGNIFSFKPAPIQINYLGYPGTLGQDGIDYIIADKFVIPNKYQDFYSEKIIFLNNCFYPTDNNRIISKKNFNRMDLEINEDAFVFCSLNNSYKITAQEIEVWSRVLLNVKNSFLVLLSNNQEMKKNIIVEVIKNKINPDCIKFVEYLDYENHMARHLMFDLFLDSFNINAHTSAVDSLWAGLPILTKVGKSFSSRICGSILNSVGLSNLITYSKEEYEQKAIYFGNNKKEILKIKNSILESKKKKIFYDIKKYTLKLEKAYEKAHSLRIEKKKPTNFEIN